MSEHQDQEPQAHKGIFLLPNLLTTGGLFSGFYAVVASMNGDFKLAAVAIFIAMIFDGLDGRVARMTNTSSAFGAEYDSMADMVSFGVAPALIAYNWGLSELGKVGWLAAFIFVAGAALRLARFNTMVGVADKRYFQGLASPAAAGIIAGMVWLGSDYEVVGHSINWIVAAITIVSGSLMVSNFRYHSFKDVDWKGRVSFLAILVIVLVYVVIATNPSLVLFVIFAGYAISGPFVTIRGVRKLKMEHVVGDSDDADFDSSNEAKQSTQDKAETPKEKSDP
ncbi:CDP-diacylglycerol--serine O-phosphatidyltransferase [Echinimonas agarilytica]|uniref:CDP-diacylglycerol--serine O-phosphatidyltransferase n=1 Tax=Echinimonas agarilytica TaxID=1215918 RepID=A0AA42B886_9GAMM|nr:CDP-diacylglycerol--serine O-phosphatidyltransferase [Echinimonas agarilytica]MCM2680619.1 CDP-diacylglycerol--serine O-phosphatidyltransferase [Echinimonas agarilytica]